MESALIPNNTWETSRRIREKHSAVQPFVETACKTAHLCKMPTDLSGQSLPLHSMNSFGHDTEPPYCFQCLVKGLCSTCHRTASHGPCYRSAAHHNTPQQNNSNFQRSRNLTGHPWLDQRELQLVAMQRGHNNIHCLSSKFSLVTSTLNIRTMTCTTLHSRLPFPSNWFFSLYSKAETGYKQA